MNRLTAYLTDDVHAERARHDAAAPFDEVAAAVELIGLRAADAADDERVRAEPPAWRAIAHVDADADVAWRGRWSARKWATAPAR